VEQMHERSYDRQLFDLIERISTTRVEGAFARSLAEGIYEEFRELLQIEGTGVLRPQAGSYVLTDSTGEGPWDRALPMSVRAVQRRLAAHAWWVRRGLQRDRDGESQWFDLILIPIDPDLRHVLGIITRSLAGDEGANRELRFNVMAQLIRLAVDRYRNRERLDEIFAAARNQQLSLLPAQIPALPGFQAAGISIPAEEVGGDYYHVSTLQEGSVAAAIADAKGKGFEAAMLATALHYGLRIIVQSPYKVAHKAGLLNRSLVQREGELHNLITMFYAELDPDGRIVYVNCSHPPPLVVHKNSMEELSDGGLFLGLSAETRYRFGLGGMNPGDLLIMYTDGWTETFNDRDEEFGLDRLRSITEGCHDWTPDAVIELIQREVEAFRGDTPIQDDRTLLVLKKM
jgi:serine phosphatase RsbU (regulator of sigma subunit)